MRWLFKTQNDAGMLFARLALAFALFPHGAQKVLGWFQSADTPFATSWNMPETVDTFQQAFGLDPWIAYVTAGVELLAPVALVLGLFGRLAGLGVVAIMAGAAWKSSLEGGNFMDWWIMENMGLAGGFHVLAIGIGLALLVRGSGALSVDRALGKPSDDMI